MFSKVSRQRLEIYPAKFRCCTDYSVLHSSNGDVTGERIPGINCPAKPPGTSIHVMSVMPQRRRVHGVRC